MACKGCPGRVDDATRTCRVVHPVSGVVYNPMLIESGSFGVKEIGYCEGLLSPRPLYHLPNVTTMFIISLLYLRRVDPCETSSS